MKYKKKGGESQLKSPKIFKSVESPPGYNYSSKDEYNSKYSWNEKEMNIPLNKKKQVNIGYNPFNLQKVSIDDFKQRNKDNHIVLYNDLIKYPLCIRRSDLKDLISENDFILRCHFSQNNPNHLNFRKTMADNDEYILLHKFTKINLNNNIDIIPFSLFDKMINNRTLQDFYLQNKTTLYGINKPIVEMNPNGYDVDKISDFVFLRDYSKTPINRINYHDFSFYLEKILKEPTPKSIWGYKFIYDLVNDNELINNNYKYKYATKTYNEFDTNVGNMTISETIPTHHLVNYLPNNIPITIPNIQFITKHFINSLNFLENNLALKYVNGNNNINIDYFLTNSKINAIFNSLYQYGLLAIGSKMPILKTILSLNLDNFNETDYINIHNIIIEMDSLFKSAILSENSLVLFQSVYSNLTNQIYGYDVFNKEKTQHLRSFLITNTSIHETLVYEIEMNKDFIPSIIEYVLEDGIPFLNLDNYNKFYENDFKQTFNSILLPRNTVGKLRNIKKGHPFKIKNEKDRFIKVYYVDIYTVELSLNNKQMYAKSNICKQYNVFDLI
jgi:hypothetical protein